MNKIIANILTCTVGIAMITACSDNELTTDGSLQINDIIENAMQEGDVEISLGATTAAVKQSRASIESYESEYFMTNPNDTLGVFALAVGYIDKNLQEQRLTRRDVVINWAGDWVEDEEGVKHHVWSENYSVYGQIVNAKATVSYVRNVSTIETPTVNWADGKKYFPLISLHRYNFYAYNPRVDSIIYGKDSIVAVMDKLNGTEDVIWGSVKPTDEDPCWSLAYCADYFREKRSADRIDEIKREMRFKFKHKMMRLTFSITPGANNDPDDEKELDQRDYSEALKTTVHSICITNAPDEVKLVLADQSDEIDNKEGELTYSAKRNKTYWLRQWRTNAEGKNVVDTLFAPITPELDAVTGEPIKKVIGEHTLDLNLQTKASIMLPVLTPEDRNTAPYKGRILLSYDDNGETRYYYRDFVLNTLLDDTTMEDGCSYDINFKIFGPDNFMINAVQSEKYNDYVDPLKAETEQKQKQKEDKKKEEEEK